MLENTSLAEKIDEIKNKVENISGEIMEDLKPLAKKYGIWIVAGLIAIYIVSKLKK
jgi:tetrahydromethanopterin S-methyltransferase subunit G